MDKRVVFGRVNWWLKNAIYKHIEEEKEYYGIEDIKIGANPHDKEVLYKLCNLIKRHTEYFALDNKIILAVLYKIDFKIIDKGRLQLAIESDKLKEEIKEIVEYDEIW